VVTADHGQVFVPPERRFVLRDSDPLMGVLECPPSGEPAVPIFHVQRGMETQLQAELDRFCGTAYELISPSEVDQLGLYGPMALSDVTRLRLGSFIGIARQPASIEYQVPGRPIKGYPGVHGGLRPAEMRVPLIIV
jgi:hypothetical protein